MPLHRPHRFHAVIASVCLSLPLLASAAGKPDLVKVDEAWIRPAVPGQTATGGFMKLTATKDLVLTGVSSPAAGASELHEMAMEGDVMRMRAVSSIALPAGKTVALQTGPGNKHLMLMALKQPLKVGDEVSLTLKLRQASTKKAFTQTIKVPVKLGQTAPAMGSMDMAH
ncbi:MAG: copper chaperone PCu(A)C [Aquabacterium sp.]